MSNWPKKQLMFVNLDKDQNVNSKTKVDGKNKSGNRKKTGNLGGKSPSGVVDMLDIRNKRLEINRLRRLETSEEDEKFSSIGSKRHACLQMGTRQSTSMCTTIRGKKARVNIRSLRNSRVGVCLGNLGVEL